MNRIFSLSVFLFALLLLAVPSGYGQVSLAPGNLVYFQNFDTYNGTSITSVPQWNIGGSFTYRGVGNGSSNSGGAWAYGTGTDRSLGYLGSNTSPSIEYSVSFVNNTGAAITQLRISYDFEQWRYESGNTIGWTVTGTGALAAVSLSGLNTSSSNSGNNGTVQVTPKLLILNNLNIVPNATFGIKFSCSNGAGNDNGLAVDNFRLEVPCTPQTIDIDTTLCAGAVFLLHNQVYTTPQTVTDSLHTAAGCDSIRKYHLAFLPSITGAFNDTVCAGSAYNWAGQNYTASGAYSHVFTSYQGCDSTVTLHLYSRPAITHAFSDTLCAAGTYNWAGQGLTATGAYNHTFTAYTGCDSTVTLNLFVRPAVSHIFADTMCSGDVYSWAAQNLSATGQYNHTFTAITGCDSFVTLNLYVRPTITHTIADTACNGAVYNWAGQNYTSSGTYNHVFTSYTGCDSTVTLNLYVRPAITHQFADTTCAATTYNWAGQSYTTSGTYSHTFTSYTGCDSTVTLNLYIRPAITHTIADTACNNVPYNWAGQNYTATGTYNHTFTSYTGCDSTVTLNLYVRPAITQAIVDTACNNTPYNWAGQNYTTTGTYNHTFISYNGCDSTVTFNLYIRPAITHTITDTACNNIPYNWAGQNYTTTGTYNHTFTSYTGCDSTVTLALYVRPAIVLQFADTACAATTYNWAGQGYTASGTYNHTFTSYTGCDSIVTLNLYIRQAIIQAVTDTACNNMPYNWAGQNYTTTGTYSHTFASYTGCDSTVTLNLYVRPAITHQFTDTTCAATTYNWAGQGYSATGTYNHTFNSSNGCDSTVTLNLYVRPAVSTTDSQSVCNNMTYNFGGQVLNTTGVYNHTFQDVHGCDSIVTLVLQVSTAITNTVNRSICYNTTLNWGTQTLSATGTYVQTFTAASSCDSIVTMNLQVMPLITDTTNRTVCFGNTYTWGTQTLNATGTYSQVFTAANSCDSLAVIHFSVLPQQKDTLAAHICNGASYPFGGQNYTTGGYYPVSFTATNSCDSIVVLHLFVSPAATTLVIDTAACGQVIFENITYTAPATLADTFHNSQGCDSLYRTVHISTHPANPLVSVTDTTGCGTVLWQGIGYTQSTTLYDTLYSMFGCDSAVHITHIIVSQSESHTITHEMCQGETFRFNGSTYSVSGSYQQPFKNRAGCDSTVMLVVTVHPLPVITVSGYDETRNYCVGDSINLLAAGAATYTWIYTGFDTLQGDALLTTVHNYNNSLQITGTDEYGCSNGLTLAVEAHPCCNIWMPNAFSPNGDGNNDEFKPVTAGHPKNYAMRIFNRWGQNVFTTYNVEEGWKGEINGKPADIADYYYRVSGKCVNGEIIDLKGSCTLIR